MSRLAFEYLQSVKAVAAILKRLSFYWLLSVYGGGDRLLLIVLEVLKKAKIVT
ncbi:MAG: hypothetical protein Q7S87_05905 [Agitococcus sp.]|nr:hypothetical protein [Agitococcus sp.]